MADMPASQSAHTNVNSGVMGYLWATIRSSGDGTTQANASSNAVNDERLIVSAGTTAPSGSGIARSAVAEAGMNT